MNRLQYLFVLPAVLLLISACSTTPLNDPFVAFKAAVSDLAVATDTTTASLIELQETRFRDELKGILGQDAPEDDAEAADQLATQKFEAIDSLQVLDPSRPFALRASGLEFMVTEQFRVAAVQSTNVLVDYSDLLLQLVSPDLIQASTFDSLADTINASANTRFPGMDTGDIALISTAAAEITRQYLENRRKETLVKALTSYQPGVAKLAARMQEYVEILAIAYADEYQNAYDRIKDELLEEDSRERAIDEIFLLNKTRADQITTLNSLRQGYGTIPQAHAEIAKVISEPAHPATSITILSQRARALSATYDNLRVNSETARLDAVANQARSQAKVLEAEAKAAELAAANAELEVALVKAELAGDPASETLQAQLSAREELAARAAERATQARNAADEATARAADVEMRTEQIKADL